MWIRVITRKSNPFFIVHPRSVSWTSVVTPFSLSRQLVSSPIEAVERRQRQIIPSSTISRWHATDAPESGGVGGILDSNWSEHEFMQVAETSLELIFETVSKCGFNPSTGLDDFDADLSQGVLTINLGSHGTYVLNTQTPNRQIWLSSPLSGPWRYAWHPNRAEWVSSRDGHSLARRLAEEFSDAFEQTVSFNFADVIK